MNGIRQYITNAILLPIVMYRQKSCLHNKMEEKQLQKETTVESKASTIGYDGGPGIAVDIIDGTRDQPAS
ncbi:hypothetical protein D3C78_1141200 [compost metagenome]